MTRRVHINGNTRVVRFSPPGVDAATGGDDEMIFSTNRRAAFNVVAHGTVSLGGFLAYPASVSAPYCLFQIQTQGGAWATQAGWSYDGIPDMRPYWYTEYGGATNQIYWAEYGPEPDNEILYGEAYLYVNDATKRVIFDYTSTPRYTPYIVARVAILDSNLNL